LGPSFTKIIQNYEFKIKCEREFLFWMGQYITTILKI
jgi:hypothetical protein